MAGIFPSGRRQRQSSQQHCRRHTMDQYPRQWTLKRQNSQGNNSQDE